MFGLVIIVAIIVFVIAGLVSRCSSGGTFHSSDDYSSRYDHDYSDSQSSSETKERFENRYPYEYDTETGYSNSIFGNGRWSDGVGNEYEQKTDCWGSVYYEKIEDEDD